MADPGRLPLGGLRVFDAAARAGSFLEAAEALAITPGAVSRQIKGLEAELGVRLFDRANRKVRLTEAGESLAAVAAKAFDQLAAGLAGIRPEVDEPLVVSVMHSMAAKWLAPRLARYSDTHPGQEIVISASDYTVDLAREGIHLAIRSGRGPYPGLHVDKLARVRSFAVCSPAMAAGLRTPADLAGAVLLQDFKLAYGEPSWPDWVAAAGVEGLDATRGPRFSNTYLAVEAAMAGQGVAITQEAMVLDDLAAGRLVRLFDVVLDSPIGYWLLTLPEQAERPALRRLRRWLLAQARADGLPLS